MKKRIILMSVLLGIGILMLSACADNSNSQDTIEGGNEDTAVMEATSEMKESIMEAGGIEDSEVENEDVWESTETSTGSNILIVYFTRLENTDADLDAIVQGGGPYGEIGSSYDSADLDAIASASITVRDGEAEGNTQVVAEMIQELTGGDIFSIQTENDYPVDYDELIDFGGEEQGNNVRPVLLGEVEHMENYDIVFLGFPNWWHDMPMAMYSFLESYDLSGKTVIPFATSAGSGLSNAASTIRELQPEANVSDDGLHVPMREVSQAEERVEEWLLDIGVS